MVPEQFLTKDVTLTLKTTAGDIPVKLTASKAPCAASTIASLAKQGFYDKTVCHRITTEEIYVLQCGDPDGTGEGGPGFVFKDEYPVGTDESNLYKPGVVAMANAGQNTNGSQFFLTYADSPLPAYYTIFGNVSEAGMKTVQAIAKKGTKGGVPDDAGGERHRPRGGERPGQVHGERSLADGFAAEHREFRPVIHVQGPQRGPLFDRYFQVNLVACHAGHRVGGGLQQGGLAGDAGLHRPGSAHPHRLGGEHDRQPHHGGEELFGEGPGLVACRRRGGEVH